MHRASGLSGHCGDSTDLLRAMIAAELQNAAFYALFDPHAMQGAIACGVGDQGNITLGSRHDPQAGGGPLTVSADVVSLTDG
jgi:microcystin degradation protein MlrC